MVTIQIRKMIVVFLNTSIIVTTQIDFTVLLSSIYRPYGTYVFRLDCAINIQSLTGQKDKVRNFVLDFIPLGIKYL